MFFWLCLLEIISGFVWMKEPLWLSLHEKPLWYEKILCFAIHFKFYWGDCELLARVLVSFMRSFTPLASLPALCSPRFHRYKYNAPVYHSNSYIFSLSIKKSPENRKISLDKANLFHTLSENPYNSKNLHISYRRNWFLEWEKNAPISGKNLSKRDKSN